MPGLLCDCESEGLCELFICDDCERDVPACKGHADNFPELCDDCWAEKAKVFFESRWEG